MALEALISPLLNVPLFQGLSSSQLERIASSSDRIVYRPGDTLIKDGADGDAAILIIGGEAVRGGEVVPVGSLVGEMAMLVETQHSTTIVARSTVRALRISRSEIYAQMAADPTLADHFVAKISGRLKLFLTELEAIDGTLAASKTMPPPIPGQVRAGAPTASAGAVA